MDFLYFLYSGVVLCGSDAFSFPLASVNIRFPPLGEAPISFFIVHLVIVILVLGGLLVLGTGRSQWCCSFGIGWSLHCLVEWVWLVGGSVIRRYWRTVGICLWVIDVG